MTAPAATQPGATRLPSGSLSPADSMKDNLRAVGGSILLISANAEAVMNQPLFDVKMLDEMFQDANLQPVAVNDHLKTAKDYANQWLTKYQKEVLNTLEHTVDYDTKFQNFYDIMLQLATDITAGNNLHDFKDGLGQLQASVDNVVTDLQKAADDLGVYRVDLEKDISTFRQDVLKIQATIGSLEVQASGDPLFTTPAAAGIKLDAISGALDERKTPDALKDLFSAHNIALDGKLVVNMQQKDKQWAINSVSAGDDKTYEVVAVYLVQMDTDGLKVYKATQGVLADLQSKIAAERQALVVDGAIIAGGVAGVLLGAVVIFIGVVSSFATAGATAAVIGAGIALVGGGGAAITYASIDYDKQSKNLSQDLSKLAEDEAILAIVPSVMASVENLVDGITNAEVALDTLLNGWKTLQNSMADLVIFLDVMDQVTAADGDSLVTELNLASDAWKTARGQAELVLCNLTNRPDRVVLTTPAPNGATLSTEHPEIAAAAKAYAELCAKQLGLLPAAA